MEDRQPERRFQDQRHREGVGSEQPGVPVETILAIRVANPIMVVDEIDKASTTFSNRGTSSSLTTR